MFPVADADPKATKTDEGTTQIQLEEPIMTNSPYIKNWKCAITVVLALAILVAGVLGSIALCGKFFKSDTEIVYRTLEDKGVKHSIEIITSDTDRVETVIFEKIDNVTTGGTLIFDFNQKLVAAYSDADNACYLWVDESLDWDDRDWLFNGDSPSYVFNKNEEIPNDFLQRVVVSEISDVCFGVKTYWATAEPRQTPYTLTDVDSASLRDRRDAIIIRHCRCSWYGCQCNLIIIVY